MAKLTEEAKEAIGEIRPSLVAKTGSSTSLMTWVASTRLMGRLAVSILASSAATAFFTPTSGSSLVAHASTREIMAQDG